MNLLLSIPIVRIYILPGIKVGSALVYLSWRWTTSINL